MLRKPENNYSKTTHRWWIWLISICAIGFIIRLYFLPFDVPFTLDNIDYFGYAIEIKNIGELPKNWHIANNGWPSFMGVLFSIIPSEVFFDFVNFIRISTSIISVITVIPIYLLCKKMRCLGKNLDGRSCKRRSKLLNYGYCYHHQQLYFFYIL